MKKRARPKLLFDREDYELVELVDEFVSKGKRPKHLQKLFDPYLHPRGIKELVATSEQRIAWAVLHLLDTLEVGQAEERVVALRALRDEVLHGGAGSLRRNTARVLLEIMKNLVRERRYWRQVELAHDFFAASTGRPAIIRAELRRLHLLEMPEEWNQLTFDHHVHDANTKGRKAPTHLIMDAWIKGIRTLTVIYYNFIPPEAFAELAQAAEIMGIDLRVGVELAARFRGKYVQLIWMPRGFSGWQEVLSFLAEPKIRAFLEQGKDVSKLQKAYVLALLNEFNERHLPSLNETYRLDLAPLKPRKFLSFVGVGQPSVEHLSEYIYQLAYERMQPLMAELRQAYCEADPAERERLEELVEQLNHLLPSTISATYLAPERNPDLPDPRIPRDEPGMPALLKVTPRQLFASLDELRSGYRITLNTTDLTPADVLELLWEAEGSITHIELFNLKDYRQGKHAHAEAIARIRQTLNGGSPIATKRMIETIMADIEATDDPEREARLDSCREMLANIPRFSGFYAASRLRSRIGSDSTGRGRMRYGMGLVVKETLPHHAQRELDHHPGTRETIPVRTEALRHTIWRPRESPLPWLDLLYRGLRRIPGLRMLGFDTEDRYVIQENATVTDPRGNIATLGGYERSPSNELQLDCSKQAPEDGPRFRWRYLNSRWSNAFKVLIGFVPAFLTFYLTKEWWLLAYGGALIWFGITGVRNVLQSIAGGGGLFRSKLLKWKDLVSWQRVADSLLYTGFSVPLLDWLVKSVLLDQSFGITTMSSPTLLYTLLALANGTYLASHNTFRGLPKAAVIGNLFRSVLSIPIAIALNALLLQLLLNSGMGEAAANLALQKWAAVIGKAASDVVAGIIEGLADRSTNMRIRRADLKLKFKQLLDIHGRLEVLFPEENVLELLESPKRLLQAVSKEGSQIETSLIINALDLMYFWMYQPRARKALQDALLRISDEERQIILRTQQVLRRQKVVSELFLNDLVGKSFAKPLAFYLDKSASYLAGMKRLRELQDEQANRRER